MRRTTVFILAGLVLVGPLKAYDDGRGRLGLQVDYSKNISTDTVPMSGAGPLFVPQGSQAGGLIGLGLALEWRLGSATAHSLQRLALVPSLALRMGTDQDAQAFPSLGANLGGQAVSLANATTARKTTTTEMALAVPLRWYLMEAGWRGEGFFLETGPQVVHTDQKVDLGIQGTSGAQAVALSDSTTYVKNRAGWMVGLGGVIPLGDVSHMSIGLEYSKVPESGSLPTTALRAFIQFMF